MRLFAPSVSLGLGQEISILLKRGFGQSVLFPQVRRQVGIGRRNGEIGGLHKVTHGFGASLGLSVDILNTGKLKQFLGDSGSDNSSSSGGRDKADTNRSAFSGDLSGSGVGSSDLVTPVTSSHWQNGKLGGNDGTSDGSGDFFGAFNTQSDMAITISDNNKSLESSSLTGSGLFLDRHDLHNFILQLVSKEVINYLVFLHGKRKQVNFFQSLDVAFADKATQLGDWDPFFLF